MNILRDLFYAFLLPPPNLILLGLVGLILIRWRRRGSMIGRSIVAFSLVALFALSLPAVSSTLLDSLEADLPSGSVGPLPGTPPPAAIVILGGDASYGSQSGLFLGSGIGGLTLERMRGGAALYRETKLPVLTTGGTLEPDAAAIGTQMAIGLRDEFATPVAWVEDRSATTWENAEFSATILKENHISSVYVVTHAWHMRRAIIAFKHFGITVTPAPLYDGRRPTFYLNDFIPHADALQDAYYAFHEWIGCLDYALRR